MSRINKYILSLLLACFFFGNVSAQSIACDNATVDIGQILYFQPSSAVYTLKNATSKSLKIKEVELGCGCMKVVYPQGQIAPGESFKLNVWYDGKQLGHFTRNIFVTDDTSDTPLILTLKGNVVMKVENFSGEYPIKLGNLLADQDAVEYDDVNKGEHFVQDIHIMNPSGQYVEPVVLHTPPYLRTEIIPSRLAPKKGGILRITLDSYKLRSYGLNQTDIYLASTKGEKVSEDKAITVSAVLLPPQITKDDKAYQTAPHIKLSANKIDLRNFNGKAKKKTEVIITNTGKSMLEITSMQMFTPGIQVTLPKRNLKPGESTKMKITGIAAQLKNVRTRPRILMITNAPDNQKVVLDIEK